MKTGNLSHTCHEPWLLVQEKLKSCNASICIWGIGEGKKGLREVYLRILEMDVDVLVLCMKAMVGGERQ
jgi:hypothetical protein